MRGMKLTMIAVTALAGSTILAKAAEAEVLQRWTSGGEASALEVLNEDIESRSVAWKDIPAAAAAELAKVVAAAKQ